MSVKKKIFRCLLVAGILALFVGLLWLVLRIFGLSEILSDAEKLRRMILDAGVWGYAVFFAIQLLQVVVLPAPAAVFHLAGTLVYGPNLAFAFSSVSVIIGSVIAFFIGRVCGKRAVEWCIGKEMTEKYTKMLGKKGNLLFVIMQLLPFFPDDILCMVAGLSPMKFSFFLPTVILVRPIFIAAVCYFGTGDIIPFHGWGIPVWIGIFLFFGIAFILYVRYQGKIEAFLRRTFTKDKSDRED